jgi:SAM-dependent methyltransferase
MREVPFFGELYRRTTAPLLSAQVTRAEARFIAATLGVGAGVRVLDVGCGEGRHLELLQPDGARLYGVDLDRVSLASARRFAQVVGGDLRALPLASASLDAAFCWYSTLFVFDEEGNRQALCEIARVLRAGGRFLFQTVNALALAAQPTARFERRLPDGSIVREESRFDPETGVDEGTRTLEQPDKESLRARYRLRYYRSAELARLFDSCGLRIEETYGGVGGEAFAPEGLDLIALAARR